MHAGLLAQLNSATLDHIALCLCLFQLHISLFSCVIKISQKGSAPNPSIPSLLNPYSLHTPVPRLAILSIYASSPSMRLLFLHLGTRLSISSPGYVSRFRYHQHQTLECVVQTYIVASKNKDIDPQCHRWNAQSSPIRFIRNFGSLSKVNIRYQALTLDVTQYNMMHVESRLAVDLPRKPSRGPGHPLIHKLPIALRN